MRQKHFDNKQICTIDAEFESSSISTQARPTISLFNGVLLSMDMRESSDIV